MFHELGGGGVVGKGGNEINREGGGGKQADNSHLLKETQPPMPKAGEIKTAEVGKAGAGSDKVSNPEAEISSNIGKAGQVVADAQQNVGKKIAGLSDSGQQADARKAVNETAGFYASGQYAEMVARMTGAPASPEVNGVADHWKKFQV